jgi:NAD-dependent DNA ligase
MAAYAYHVDHDPIISDSQYDRMIKRMLDHWSEIEHKHKELISIKDHHVETYPFMIKTAVKDMRRNMKKV